MISIRHLCKKYDSVTPLKDVNAEINQGDVISVIGPSGTGKSTLLRLLNRLETPTSGEIWVDGVNICEKNTRLDLVRRKMGMVFQSFNLFEHRTVIENVMMAPMDILGVSKQEAYDNGMQLLAMVGLDSKALNYPNVLSGGQKQRVAIARTLAMKPEIILFDEPTSALDPTMVGEVLSVIKNLAKQGYTMLIVTHEMKFARDVSNRVFYMDQGIIYDDDKPEVIFDNPQKPRTREFIKRIKAYRTLITAKAFDFIGAVNGMQEFARKLWWSKKQSDDACLVFEEMAMQAFAPVKAKGQDIDFALECSETDNSVKMIFQYAGDDFDPTEACDEISLSLIKSKVSAIVHVYHGGNCLTLTLSGGNK